jgi:hypothetical protein
VAWRPEHLFAAGIAAWATGSTMRVMQLPPSDLRQVAFGLCPPTKCWSVQEQDTYIAAVVTTWTGLVIRMAMITLDLTDHLPP